MTGTILTVDDSASMRQMVAFTLQGAGYQVVEAKDGQEALTKLDASIRLVITDLNMPILDGIGVIKGVRAHAACRYVPVIVLTTESQAERRQEARAAGATGWIVKPFRPDQLLAVVQKVCGN